MKDLTLHFEDNRSILPTLEKDSVDCVLTSPPYWGLRDYGTGPGQLGLEPTWQLFIKHMVEISSLLKRVLKPTGSYYLVMGDTYASSPVGRFTGGGKQFAGRNMSGIETSGQIDKSKPMDASDVVTKPKQLLLIPSRLAIALQEDGWTLRNKIIWYKPNHMPSSVKDRLTNSYEEIFHFVQQRKYYYDLDSIREPHKVATERWPDNLPHRHAKNIEGVESGALIGSASRQHFQHERSTAWHPSGKNPGDTIEVGAEVRPKNKLPPSKPRGKGWEGSWPGGGARIQREGDPRWLSLGGKNPGDFSKINTKPYPEAHFAVFPEDICIPRIKSSCPENGVVLDPFAGSGTTLKVALDLGRKAIGIEINQDYQELIERRLSVHNQIWKEKYAIQDAKDNGIIPLSEW